MSNQTELQADEFVLLLLSDSNLPTGGFVSSSGLESYVNHSFMNHCKTDKSRSKELVRFIHSSLHSYASLSVPFFYHLSTTIATSLSSLDGLLQQQRSNEPNERTLDLEDVLLLKTKEQIQKLVSIISKLNQLYQTMCLSNVNQRNSHAQGTAMLILYTKSFVPSNTSSNPMDRFKHQLIDTLKSSIRQDKWSIHFTISFALISTLMGLNFDRAIHLHLFLQIRSILSSAVRLNLIGLYVSQRILNDEARSLLNSILIDLRSKRLSRIDRIECGLMRDEDEAEEDGIDVEEEGPANTWPFGEIIMNRHDVCHVRLFNS